MANRSLGCHTSAVYLYFFDRSCGSMQQTSLPTLIRHLHVSTLNTLISHKSSPHSRSPDQPVYRNSPLHAFSNLSIIKFNPFVATPCILHKRYHPLNNLSTLVLPSVILVNLILLSLTFLLFRLSGICGMLNHPYSTRSKGGFPLSAKTTTIHSELGDNSPGFALGTFFYKFDLEC